MTTYTYVPRPTRLFVNWSDPTIWAGTVVPNTPDADVVLPLAAGNTPTIDVNGSFTTRSVTDMGADLNVLGTLSVTGALNLGAATNIELAGGTLSFGSLASLAPDIQGSGQITTPGPLTNTQSIIDDGPTLTLTAASLLNPGTLSALGQFTVDLTDGNAGSSFANGVLADGTYSVGPAGTLTLDTGAAITAVAVDVDVDVTAASPNTGDIQSYDPTTATTRPLGQTLQTVLPTGNLVVAGNGYDTAQALTDEGTISLGNGTLTTPGLTVTPSGSVVGYGTLAGPVQNDGTVEPTTYVGVSSGNIEPKLVLTGPVTGTGTLLIPALTSGAEATIELAGPDTGSVTFANGMGILVLDDPADVTGTIAVQPTSGAEYSHDTPEFSSDLVVLTGIALSSVTATSFTPTTAGGTLTIQEGATQQTLAFAGSNLVAASFALSTPQSNGLSGLEITVTPAPNAPTLTAPGGGPGLITNTATPTVTGTLSAGSAITFLVNGVAADTLTAYNGNRGNFSSTPSPTGSYAGQIYPGLALGPQQLAAIATNAAGSATSAPLGVDVLPAPFNGVTVAGSTSLDLARLLGQGYAFQFATGTEALQLTDGTLSVGPDTTQALVQRLYEGLLGRAGDPAGLGGFNAMLANGATPATVATLLLGSSEYQSLHGPQTPTQFVTSLYEGFLSRAPSQSELAAWVNNLAAGLTQGQVAADVAQSPEAASHLASDTAHVWVPSPQGGLVTELYGTGLGRAPDLPSLTAWEQQLNAGLTPQQLAFAIASSAEFATDHAGSSNAAYVTSLYQNGLGRTPAPGELQGWTNQLQAGAGATNVLYAIATSAEAGSHLLPAV